MTIRFRSNLSKVFYYRDESGRRISRGGGRTNDIYGEHSGAGASIPLKYWKDMKNFGIDDQKRLLLEHAWPVEFERIKSHLLSATEIRADQIVDVARSNGFADEADSRA